MIHCKSVEIAGISACIPKQVEDNSMLKGLSDRARQEIVDKIGIRYRRISSADQCASDLCVKPAGFLLKELGWSVGEVGLLVFVTQTPDFLIPGSAAHIAYRLGLNKNALVIDINQGCSGYVNGLAVASGLMESYGIDRGLLLVGDTITKNISENDLSLRPIFSDAGSATALQLKPGGSSMKFLMGSLGNDHRSIYVPHGGGRNPIAKTSLTQIEIEENVVRSNADLAMNGKDVFTFGLTEVPRSINQLMNEIGESADSIQHLILHQANQLLSDLIAKKTGFGKDQTPSSLHQYGNTSCATIPVTLVTQMNHKLESGKRKLLLSGFGVGLSWANAFITTDTIVCPEVLEE